VWTCHKDTKKGDLVLLWRTSPKKDIGYLVQAESDSYSIVDDNDHGWQYGCDYQMLYKFNHPISVKDLRNDPYLMSGVLFDVVFSAVVLKYL
jgi:hypothetical protein